MSYLASIGLSLFFLGVLFLLKSRKNRKFLWAGIPVLIIGALMVFYIITVDVDTDLIGMEILKDEPQEFIVELHYFPTKAEALAFYDGKGVKEFLLLAKYEGKAEDFFKMLNITPTPDGGKRVAFLENAEKKESAQIVFQDFYMTHKLFTVYNSYQRKNQQKKMKNK